MLKVQIPAVSGAPTVYFTLKPVPPGAGQSGYFLAPIPSTGSGQSSYGYIFGAICGPDSSVWWSIVDTTGIIHGPFSVGSLLLVLQGRDQRPISLPSRRPAWPGDYIKRVAGDSYVVKNRQLSAPVRFSMTGLFIDTTGAQRVSATRNLTVAVDTTVLACCWYITHITVYYPLSTLGDSISVGIKAPGDTQLYIRSGGVNIGWKRFDRLIYDIQGSGSADLGVTASPCPRPAPLSGPNYCN